MGFIRSFTLAFTALLALILTSVAPVSATAAELVMFTRDGCPWCARFEREVAPAYHRTEEGQRAPLRRVELKAGGSNLAGLAAPVIAAPTFVLFADGRETGRITGYQGDDAFWGLLGKMLADMPSPIHRSGTAARLD
jgi:thioredoxin-related protein